MNRPDHLITVSCSSQMFVLRKYVSFFFWSASSYTTLITEQRLLTNVLTSQYFIWSDIGIPSMKFNKRLQVWQKQISLLAFSTEHLESITACWTESHCLCKYFANWLEQDSVWHYLLSVESPCRARCGRPVKGSSRERGDGWIQFGKHLGRVPLVAL